MNEIKLHDIKSIVEVQEYSFYYLLGVIFLTIVLICGIVYLFYVLQKRRNSFNERKEHIGFLSALPSKDAKKTAYDITKFGATFKDDTQELAEVYKRLADKLEKYKYKKEVKDLDDEILKDFIAFRGLCHV